MVFQKVFHSPKRGVMSATQETCRGVAVAFHSPKRGVMSATSNFVWNSVVSLFHSPKRGVMSATKILQDPQLRRGFIPLNGASCLQPISSLLQTRSLVSFP